MTQYSTELAKKQWQVIKKLEPQARKRKHLYKFYLYANKTGLLAEYASLRLRSLADHLLIRFRHQIPNNNE